MPYLSRPAAPLALPPDIRAHPARFGLELADLLTVDNPKMAKGQALGHGAAAILHNLPARALAAAVTPGPAAAVAARGYLPPVAALAAREGLTAAALAHNGCLWATGCAACCLNWSGRGGLGWQVAACRARRTLAMVADPVVHARAVLWATARAHRWAHRQGLPTLALRLRGTDEGPRIGWHRLALPVTPTEAQALGRRFGLPVAAGDGVGHTLAQALAPARADGLITLFDYSKAPLGGPLGLEAQRAAGWDITASMAADRATAAADAIAALSAGFRLALPVAHPKGHPLPVALTLTAGARTLTVPTVDGDRSDHRYRDPHGVAVILRTKRSRGADPATAAPFSLAPHGHPQPLPDGVALLTY